MNGKHPIDDLFARGLRDAEAQPPTAVWEGIVRERGRGKRAAVKRRSRWGLAALLLLLLGAAGYWTLADQGSTSSAGKEQAAVPPSGGAASATVETSVVEEPKPANPNGGQADPASGTSTSGDQNEPRPAATSSVSASDGIDANAEPPTMRTAEPKTSDKAKKPVPANVNVRAASTKTTKTSKFAREGKTLTDRDKDTTSDVKPAGAVGDGSSIQAEGSRSSDGSGSAASNEPGTLLPTSAEQHARVSPDVHLPALTGLVTPFMNNPATAPGPLLQGDSTPAYVLKKGNWWLAAQGEMSMLNGSWTGTGREVTELNESETWKGGQGLGLVVGREWLSGWSVGLGIGASMQRSRFLRREVEAAQTETVVDTTWTGTPMGTQTNYTWDIVETVMTEPGVEHDYSATNSYTRLRIAPELSRDLLRKKRLTLIARLTPVMMFDIGRKGNTIVPASATDSLETMTNATATGPLSYASLDERFPMTLALSGGLELRYRLCERWSVGVLPTFTYWIPRAEGRVPSLSMNELGGAVRLRYDLRHNERRVK